MNTHFPNSNDLQTLVRLIAEPEMEDVWEKLTNLLDEKRRDVELAKFAFNVCRIMRRWSAAPRKTLAVLRSEYRESADMADELATRLTSLRLDQPISGLLELAHEKRGYANQPSFVDIVDRHNAIMFPSISDVLHELSGTLRDREKHVTPITTQRNRSTSERNHFIRQLDAYLRANIGKPMSREVATISNIFFQRLPVTYCEVQQICR